MFRIAPGATSTSNAIPPGVQGARPEGVAPATGHGPRACGASNGSVMLDRAAWLVFCDGVQCAALWVLSGSNFCAHHGWIQVGRCVRPEGARPSNGHGLWARGAPWRSWCCESCCDTCGFVLMDGVHVYAVHTICFHWLAPTFAPWIPAGSAVGWLAGGGSAERSRSWLSLVDAERQT